MRVDLEDLEKHLEFRRVVNEADIQKIQIFRNGKRVRVKKKSRDEWKFTGLSNIYFLQQWIDE